MEADHGPVFKSSIWTKMKLLLVDNSIITIIIIVVISIMITMIITMIITIIITIVSIVIIIVITFIIIIISSSSSTIISISIIITMQSIRGWWIGAIFQEFDLDKWAQLLGDLNFQRAFRVGHKQWFWDLRPSH